MQAMKKIVSQTVVLPQTDIDTDQIIPARYLTTTSRQGISDGLFTTGATTLTAARTRISP